MSITLDSTLQTAQDGSVHNPIIELTSHNPVASIPFDGYKISGLSAETEPKLIMTSTGRLVYVYLKDGLPMMGYSDLDRTQWYNANALSYPAGYLCSSIDCCEMTGGNIAIIATFYATGSTSQYVQSMVYSPTATLVSARVTAFSWSTNENDYGITLALTGTTYRWILAAYSGSTYYLRTGTSTDELVSWNTATTFTPTGLSSTYPYGNPYLFFPENDDAVLVFDYTASYNSSGEPLVNIYLMESADSGATWGTPTALTSYTTYDTIASQPAISQTAEDEMLLTFREQSPTLYMGRDATGWSPEAGGIYPEAVGTAVFEPVTRKIYHLSTGNYGTNNGLWGVTEIDLDDWEATDYWDSTSSPSLARGGDFEHRNTRVVDGCVISYLGQTDDSPTYFKIDPVGNTITYYSFGGAFAATNVNWTQAGAYNYKSDHMDIDEDGILYSLFRNTNGVSSNFKITALDTSASGPSYTFDYNVTFDTNTIGGSNDFITAARVFKSEDYFIIANDINGISLHVASSGLVSDYWVFTNPAYNVPNARIDDMYMEGDSIYLAINGEDGLWKFSISGETATQILPPYTQYDSFDVVQYDSTLRCLMCTSGAGSNDGLFVYYIDLDEWDVYRASNISGITPDGTSQFATSFYDSVNDGFVVGIYDELLDPSNEGGILFIPREGKINLIKYATGTESSGWTFDTPAQLVTDYSATNATTAYVEGSSEFYALWVDEDPQEVTSSLTWDKNESLADITGYIVRQEPISITPNVAGTPSALSLQLGDGHLFDEFNLASMLRPYVKKGRKLVLRFGETVSSTDYFVNQGWYYVEQKAIEYARSGKMVMRVTALDRLSQIQELEISATEYLSNVAASLAYKTFAEDLGAVDSASEIADTPFIADESLSAQFIDMTLYEILYTLSWRYGCMPRYDFDGYLDSVRVPSTTVSHTYSDNDAVIKFTPDDTYGDKTNKVVVEGEYPDLTEVIHSEELLGQISGSVGWWGDSETYRVYYSQDQEKRALNPRLNVVSTAESIALRLAGEVEEYISYEDTDNKYVDVKVDAPNLTAALVAALAGYGAGVWIGDETTLPGAPTIPIGKPIAGASLLIAAQILGSIASFQYEIWAQPLGYVTRTIQSSDTDDENIAYVGKTFSKTLTGYNCDSVADCLAVAQREIVIATAQRNRVVIAKKAHLQDEPGDLISILHPISGQAIEVCIVEMTRTYQQGNGFFDVISGWVMS